MTLEWAVDPTGAGDAQPTVDLTSTGATVTANDPGDYMVTVRSGDVSAKATLAVGDSVAPVITGMQVSIADASSVGPASARLDVAWTTVESVAVASTKVQRRIGTGGWKNVSVGSPGAASVEVAFGKRIQFRVRATDAAGNVGAWAQSAAYRVVAFERSGPGLALTGAWKTKAASQAIGGQFLRSRVAGASATLAFNGVQVALIGNRGPNHGRADINLGGSLASSVPLAASSLELRQILYLSPVAASAAASTLQVFNRGAPASPTLDIDAFLVLTPAT